MIRKNKCFQVVFLFIIIVFGSFSILLCNQVESLPKGVLIKKVACIKKPVQSYALYLPSYYEPGKKWPVLYAFDPAAFGAKPINAFRGAAEQYGVIVAGSNNSRNGPVRASLEAALAMWNDTHRRFNIDNQRIYVTGFSGGSRVASLISLALKQPIRGIIGCGAGKSTGLKWEKFKPTAYCGIVGLADFNYKEMVQLEEQLTKRGYPNRFIYFQGGHAWPAAELCTRAFEWLEILAIKTNIRTPVPEIIDGIFKKEKNLAKKLHSQKDSLYFAMKQYHAILTSFSGLKETKEIEQKIKSLKAEKGYKKFIKAEKKRLDKEKRYNQQISSVFALITQEDANNIRQMNIQQKLEISRLKKQAADGKNLYTSSLAKRLLYSLWIYALQKGDTFLGNKQTAKAIIFYEIAIQTVEHPYLKQSIYYNLACAYALVGNKKKALNSLEGSVKNGFGNVDHILKDPDLATIRNHKRFKEIVATIKK